MFISGCGNTFVSTNSNANNSQKEPIEWELTTETVSSTGLPVYTVEDTLPLLANSEQFGSMRINWIQKVGISDFNDTVAAVAGIDYSYSINLAVDMSDVISDGEELIVYVEPAIVTENGKTIGKKCNVGWTGFPKTAQLYDNSSVVNVEVGLQPEQAVADTDSLVFTVKDNKGRIYDNITLDAKCLETAEDTGITLSYDSKSIEAINGSVFSISVADVSINSDTNISGELEERYYDVDYTVSYDKAATNEREDLLFDNTNGNRLRSQFTFNITSDVDDTLLYNTDTSAVRQLYNDSDLEKGCYVSTDYYDLDVGYHCDYTTNRVIPDTTVAPKYVRLSFEFPDEAKARSLEEMRYFNGRFCVIQREITARVIPERPEVDTP